MVLASGVMFILLKTFYLYQFLGPNENGTRLHKSAINLVNVVAPFYRLAFYV